MANTGKTPPTDPLTAGERRTAWWIIASVAVALAVAVVAFAVGHRSRAPGPDEQCITVSIASSMGGGVEHACGAAARTSCQAAAGKQDRHSTAVGEACRSAGIRQ